MRMQIESWHNFEGAENDLTDTGSIGSEDRKRARQCENNLGGGDGADY
jgi:hypothetical protein